MPYVNQRWLGGMLTNFETIAKRVAKMQEYQRMRDSGEFEAMPKKEALILGRELEKLERNLSGIRTMTRRPDAVFVLDTKKEHLAVAEANKLGIPVVAVVDTNCDPDLVQYVIPGNDDAIRASHLLCRVISDAVIEGRYIASKRNPAVTAPAAPVRSPRRKRRSCPTRRRPVVRRPPRKPSARRACRRQRQPGCGAPQPSGQRRGPSADESAAASEPKRRPSRSPPPSRLPPRSRSHRRQAPAAEPVATAEPAAAEAGARGRRPRAGARGAPPSSRGRRPRRRARGRRPSRRRLTGRPPKQPSRSPTQPKRSPEPDVVHRQRRAGAAAGDRRRDDGRQARARVQRRRRRGRRPVAARKGLAKAAERSDRDSAQGAVALFVDDNVGSIVQLKCETDFVARPSASSHWCRTWRRW